MTSQWGLSFFGQNANNLFGIEHQYLTNVAYKETFHLVGYGFDYDALRKMPIALRRHYFFAWIEQKTAEKESQKSTQQNVVNYDPVQKSV